MENLSARIRIENHLVEPEFLEVFSDTWELMTGKPMPPGVVEEARKRAENRQSADRSLWEERLIHEAHLNQGLESLARFFFLKIRT